MYLVTCWTFLYTFVQSRVPVWVSRLVYDLFDQLPISISHWQQTFITTLQRFSYLDARVLS